MRRKIILISWIVFFLLCGLVVTFSLPSVQTHLGKYLSEKLKKDFHVAISISKIDCSYLGKVNLKNIYIADHHSDTLIFAKNIQTSLRGFFSIFSGKIDLGYTHIEKAILHLKTYKNEPQNNMMFFVDKIPMDTIADSNSRFVLKTPMLDLVNSEVVIENENEPPEQIVFYKKIQATILDFQIIDVDHVQGKIRNAKTTDHFGFQYETFQTDYSYSDSKMSALNTKIKTQHSSLQGDVFLEYDWEDLFHFTDQVRMKIALEESNISLEDLRNFYSEIEAPEILKISGKMKGTLNDFQLKNLQTTSENEKHTFVLKGNYNLKNSFKNWEAFSLKGNIQNLNTNLNSLKTIFPKIIGNHVSKKIITDFGTIQIKNKANVFFNHKKIESYLVAKTNMGTIGVDMVLKNFQNKKTATYKGQLHLKDFDMGNLLKNKNIGKISLNAYVQGKGFSKKKLRASLKGIVKKQQYKKYTYKNIRFEGLFKNHFFKGKFLIKDPNLKMRFEGLVDFSSQHYKFDFHTNVDHVNFKKLNLYPFAEKSIASGKIIMNIKGKDLDNLTGKIACKNTHYTNEKKNYDFADFRILLTKNASSQKIELQSQKIANGYIKGKFSFLELKKFLKNHLKSLLIPKNKRTQIALKSTKNITFDMRFYDKFINALFPKINIADNTHLYGEINSSKQKIKCFFKSKGIQYQDNFLDSISLEIDNQKHINGNLQIKNIKTKYYDIEKFGMLSKKLQDSLHFYTDFVGGKGLVDHFQLGFYHTFDGQNKGILGFEKMKMYFRGQHWFLDHSDSQQNKIMYHWKKHFLDIKKIRIRKKSKANKTTFSESSFAFWGNTQQFFLKLSNIRLKNMLPVSEHFNFQGTLNGTAELIKKQKKYYPKAFFKIQNFGCGGHKQGDLQAAMNYTKEKKYEFSLQLSEKNKKSLELIGNFHSDTKKPFWMKTTLSDFKLGICNVFTKGFLSNIKGFANGTLAFLGTLENLKINGFLDLKKGHFSYPYLHVNYEFPDNTRFYFEKNNMLLKNIMLQDTHYHTKATINGNLQYKNLSELLLDLNLKTNKFLILNTDYQKKIPYYGKAFVLGNLKLKNTQKQWQMDGNLRTLKGTALYIPLKKNADADLSFSFIEFKKNKNPLSLNVEEEKKTTLYGLNLNLDLEITKQTIAQIVIDKTYGSYLKLSGTGNLNIALDDLGNFKMGGIYDIDSGTYDLIYKGIVNKSFQIQKGSNIYWTQNPLNPNISLKAIRNVRADPKILLEDVKTKRKIPLNLQVNMGGTLFNATQKFDIVIPNTNPMINKELQFKLAENGENGKLKHFFSLLFANNFYTQENTVNYGSNSLRQTYSELIANTLSSMLNLNNDFFNLSVDYIFADKNNVENTTLLSNQVDFYLDTQIGDRLFIGGNLEVPVERNSRSNIMGTFNMELLLDAKGNLRWRVFNRRNELQYTNNQQEGYTQGTGFTYQINFSNLKEILYKILQKKKN